MLNLPDSTDRPKVSPAAPRQRSPPLSDTEDVRQAAEVRPPEAHELGHEEGGADDRHHRLSTRLTLYYVPDA